MRVIVFFDLPTLNIQDRRNYTRFRKALLKEGFLMMQESVYCKLSLNSTGARAIMNFVEDQKPPAGLVQMLAITEKQFSSMKIVQGKLKHNTLDTDERIIIL